ncbi:ANTAR domain-containing protein [Streptomyces sp. IBSBF 3136]|uniref:ANTAR domain-containing protein n=1 Tax=Streptomyces sp. IBSBF 3136 TaxID=2903524 RepID=UPI002FDC3002
MPTRRREAAAPSHADAGWRQRQRCTEEEAFDVLRRLSRQSNLTLRDVCTACSPNWPATPPTRPPLRPRPESGIAGPRTRVGEHLARPALVPRTPAPGRSRVCPTLFQGACRSARVPRRMIGCPQVFAMRKVDRCESPDRVLGMDRGRGTVLRRPLDCRVGLGQTVQLGREQHQRLG